MNETEIVRDSRIKTPKLEKKVNNHENEHAFGERIQFFSSHSTKERCTVLAGKTWKFRAPAEEIS